MAKFLKIFLFLLAICTGTGTVAGNEDSNYTAAEQKSLKQFRVKVSDLLYLDYQRDDSFLITWLRTADLDQTRARQLLATMIKWRKDNKIDSILHEKRMIQMQKEYPYSMDIVDREGRPVVVASTGAWNLRKMMLAGEGKTLTRYLDYIFEKASALIRDLSNSTQTDITQIILLIDMSGFSPRTHACLRCIPFFTDLIQHYSWYYPLGAKYIILINTSRSFGSLLRIILPIMPPVLQRSLRIYGHDSSEYSKALLQLISPEALPVAYGGTKGQPKIKKN